MTPSFLKDYKNLEVIIMKLNVLEFTPKKINDISVKISPKCDFIEISRKGGRYTKSIIIRKEIEINDFFMEIIGLYFGDGLNTRKGSGNRRTAFTNSNYKLQLHWIDFLEYMGFRKEDLFAQLSIGKNYQHKNKEILGDWINKTKLPPMIFSHISNNREVTSEAGVLSLEFNSIIFRSIFNNIFDYSIDTLKQNKHLVYPFIRGIIAAEGRVALRKDSGILNYIGISVPETDRREFIKGLLRSINIKASKDNKWGEIIFHNYFNFKVARDYNLIDLHPDKKIKFHEAYSKSMKSKTNALTKVKIIKTLKKPMSRFEIAEELNMDISNIHKSLRDLEIKKVVKRYGKNGLRTIWCLNQIPEDLSILMKRDYP